MQQAIQVESPATALGNLQSQKKQQQHSWTRCEKDYSIVLKKSTGSSSYHQEVLITVQTQ